MREFWPFFLQAVLLLSYIPITFITYRRLRAPIKQQHCRWELEQVSVPGSDAYREALDDIELSPGQYVIPLAFIMVVLAALYAIAHPSVIRLGIWEGLLERNIWASHESPQASDGRVAADAGAETPADESPDH